MASSDLRSQLSCSVCLSIYTDPVTLNCGHNFCQTCTKITFDSQEVLGVYSCPECRAEFQVRPELQKNTRLCNIVEYFLSLHPEQQKENEIFCTYCGLHVPAVKTCLLCEASLCYVHLKKHSNTVEHVLTEPTSSFKSKKCSIHNEILKYYCSEDSDFVCVSCCLAGEHRGHKVELLNEVVKKKKKKLLELTKEELSWKMGLIEEVCNLNNPVTVMRDEEEYYTGYVDSDGDHLTAKQDFPPLETSDISMDINTASNWIEISSDLKSATCTSTDQNRPDLPERFESKQVLSANSFSSGRHYWEVDVSEAKEWLIGVAYPSIERKIDGEDSHIGYNDKSWALTLNPCLVALHNNKWKPVDLGYPVRSVGIFLDYEAGHLSFYQLRDPVRHLHTFAATFTEPLHAAFFIITDTCIRIAKQMMASANLRQELNCSICLSIYTDPVTLRCGHNFCKVCIRRALDTQERSGVYSCPECRKRFTERPALQRNIKLCNIVEHFLPTHPDQNKTGIFCTYCVHSPVFAVKTCLHCEASLCDTHLKKHSKSVEHVLTEPTTSLENRKCPIHKELLKYYCSEDGACVCVSCCLAGEHRGHLVELLNEASEKKRERFRDVLEKLNSKREETEKRVQSLQGHMREVKGKSADINQRVTALIRNIREQLEALEKRVLSEISRQEQQVSLQVSGLIQQLEIKKDELSRKIRHIEELCNKTDPLSVLREDQEYTDTCDMDSDGDNNECIQLDEAPISLILHRGLVHLSYILIDLKRKRPLPILETSDISLDMKTANNYIIVSSDLKSATNTSTYQRRPNGPERFKSKQVLSISNFSSGRHYWEVDVSEADIWRIGVAYPSIERKTAGKKSSIGHNDKSWALIVNPDLAAFHNNIRNKLYSDSPVRSVGIYLNYEAGRLSFYQLCGPVRHLHTFTATFTEPLHAAFYVYNDTSIRIRYFGKPSSTDPGAKEIRYEILKIFYFHFIFRIPRMASADLREELNCSICLSIYTDPVMLRCGHNFCKDCIRRVLDSQEKCGLYSCPECREEFQERPALQRNIKLCNIVQRVLPILPVQNKTGIFCTYCVHSPVPAVKTCLQCEASLCDTHLKNHSKSVEHVLTEPTTSLEHRKCPVHKELLKYYCSEDGACICVSCCLAGEHRGHQVELLNEASEKKKEKLRDVLKKLDSKREETEKRVQGLQERRREVRGKSAAETQRVTALIRDIREQLEALEKRVLSEISRQEEQVSLQVSGLIQQLELKKDELSRNIRHIEELCNKTDPLSVLREDQEYTDTCVMDSDGDNNECIQLDEAPISLILHRGLVHLSDVLIELKLRLFPILETSDISLDMKTAGNYIIVSSDLKSATCTSTYQRRPDGPERFKSKQVLSISNFSSGRHYWEVDVSDADKWLIGVAYPSIERKIAGNESFIGYNDKSWALTFNPRLAALHNNKWNYLSSDSTVLSVGIYLNYKAGRLSFYQLCDPIRHLYTFTATFTEPLHAAFFIFDDKWIRIRK
ncbi:uncharacterized protein WCC33_014200 [Rhinophrynus dorsalis]